MCNFKRCVYNGAFCGIGIVIAAIKNKARANIGAGSSAAVFNPWVGIKNAGSLAVAKAVSGPATKTPRFTVEVSEARTVGPGGQ